VRWHGRRRIERFLHALYRIAKSEDPTALVTYVNFPTTEYLRLPFLDFFCFNVYLESRQRLETYLARLQNLAGERPLVMAEIGLDSRRNGELKQAESLGWQVRTAFAAGCAGAFVFAWTDAWHRGGHDIEDWDFGLTTRAREPKAALTAVRAAFANAPFERGRAWPRISVVVCSYNGARTIRDTLDGLVRLEYPEFEVIVVNDGSIDATPRVASEYPVRLISTENQGLSSARNIGWQAATGEIVAYIDDDAWPDRNWLTYLAHTFMTDDWAGVGGPNLAPAGDGPIADCVANAPGGPVHVLLTDREAEHIPGCNMAFKRAALQAVGGFDPRYRAAGDDVDLCWRLQDRGWKIGFHPAAMVWHHRRNSVGMYWKQQQGYGKAEALLEEKWPEKYNPAGHVGWAGRLYGKGLTLPLALRPSRVYGGVWGSALFQSIYQPAPGTLLSAALMPEWYLLIAALAGVSVLGWSWPPLLLGLPLFALALAAPIAQALAAAARAQFPGPAGTRGEELKRRALTALLHLIQPAARLKGRLQHGLTPWRRRGGEANAPRVARHALWRESWRSPDEWLRALEAALREQGVLTRRGGDFDDWDLEARCGTLGAARALLAIEEHGAGKQMARFRVSPSPSRRTLACVALLVALGFAAALGQAWMAAIALSGGAIVLGWRVFTDCGRAVSSLARAVERLDAK
jgi:GT2 family glycosyltransferase